tara:strand:+ start:263 stop:502 length:240 start_codon:yes stop_codon:yes gene_type:complete
MKFTAEQIAIIKGVAIGLIDDGSNSEYCRGICEVIAELEPHLNVDHAVRAGQIYFELLPPEERASRLLWHPWSRNKVAV